MLYTDNAKIYRTQQLALICAGFGCSVVHARPYHAAGKGKQERFFGTVRTRFLSTITDENITLEELNERYWHWLDEDYHRKNIVLWEKARLIFSWNRPTVLNTSGGIRP